MKNLLLIFLLIAFKASAQTPFPLYVPTNPDSIKTVVNVNGAPRTVYNVDLVRYRAALTARDTAAALRLLISNNTTAIGLKADKANTISVNGSTQTLGSNPSFTISGGGGSSDTMFYNVATKFSADKTGTTDATTAIQNAINAAHVKGGTVYFPAGTYLHNKLTTYVNVGLLGDGQGVSILKSTNAGAAIECLNSGLSYPTNTISKLQFDGNSTGTIGIDFSNAALFALSDLSIKNFTSIGIRFTGTLIGSVSNANFMNNNIHVQADTSTLNVSPNLVVFNMCQFNTAPKYAVYWNRGQSVQFNTCDFEHNGTTNDTTTGSIYYKNAGFLGAGGNQNVGIVLNGCWFEQNAGIVINLDEPTIDVINSFVNTTIKGNSGYTVKIKGTVKNNRLMIRGGEVSGGNSSFIIDGSTASVINDHANTLPSGTTSRNNGTYRETASAISLTSGGEVFSSPVNFSSSLNKFTGALTLANQSPFYVFRNHSQATGTPSWGNIDSSEFGGVFLPQVAAAMQSFQNGWTMPFSTEGNSMGKDVGSTIYFANHTSGAGLKAGAGASGVSRVMVNVDGTTYILGSKNSIGGSSPNSVGHIQGSFATVVASKTSGYILTINDHIILADATTGAFSVTLPTAVSITGRQYIIKKTDASANAVTVITTSSQTIDGATTYALTTQNKYVTIASNGANWFIIGNN